MRYAYYWLLSFVAFWRSKPPTLGKKFLTGYGRVNSWRYSKSTLREDICRMKANKVTILSIELPGWATGAPDQCVFLHPEILEEIEEAYNFALRLCRAFGMWLHVGIVNDNMGGGATGSPKYGDPAPTLSKGWDVALKLLEIVKKGGYKNVIAQPVGETQTNAGRTFETVAVQQLRGFTTCNNSHSKPSSAAGMSTFAWHPFSISEISGSPRGALIVSDTGRIIMELGEGLSGPGNPQKLREFKAVCEGHGNPAAIYYAFLHKEHDKKAIEAMGG